MAGSVRRRWGACGGIIELASVIDKHGDPIAGLYAVGNVSGGMFAGTYPHELSGISHGRCLTFGYLLGKHLAE